MNRFKKILLTIPVVFIGIQFIQPAQNKSAGVLTTDISKMVSISDSVQIVLQNACYDCHSNNTIYPWYTNIQPMGWLMACHISQGKEALNFSAFGNYSARKKMNKLTAIANSIRDDLMPLMSYKRMHKTARLTKGEKELIDNWIQQSKDILSVKK